MLRRTLLLAALLCLATAAPARAGWFGAEAVDGPSPDIVAVADIDIARDGNGGLVYLKRVDGVARVFLSRLVDGVWRAPERLDHGIAEEATAASIAAADGHRLAVAWVSGGRVFGASHPEAEPDRPLTAPRLLFDGAAADPHVDFGINGTAYAVFTAGGADVRAARLFRDAWEPIPSVLDIDPARTAGAGTGRPRVAVSAEGNAVAVWGEDDGERRRLYGRRLTGLALSVAPQEISLGDFEGAPGGSAGPADLDIEDDGSYAWAVFRQDFGGTSRAIARRLVGSLWEAPVAIDGGGPAGAPRVAMSGRGVGAGAVANAASGSVQTALLELDAFGQSYRLDSAGSVGGPVVAASERDEQAIAWLVAEPSGATGAVARYRPRAGAFEPEFALANPVYGAVDPAGGFEAAEDRLGDMAFTFVQAGGQGRSVMVASWDRPPGRPLGLTTTKYQRAKGTRLKWRAGAELWGPTEFRVTVDDREVARVVDTDQVILAGRLPDGLHRWQVTAVDRRGQEVAMRAPRNLRIDGRRPRMRMGVTGARRRGMPIRVAVRARDPRGGAGMRRVRIYWGDGQKVTATSAVHRYARAGRYRLVVRAVDRAGNVRRRELRLRIR